MTEAEELLPREVAALVGCTVGAVHVAIHTGRLRARVEETPRGIVYRVRLEDVAAFAAGVAAWHRMRR